MIQCENGSALVDFQDEECWHCQRNLENHPLKTDVRYWLAFSRPTGLLFRLMSIVLAIGFIFLLFTFQFAKSAIVFVLMIIMLRMSLRPR
jgi:hypothetical protein